MNVKELSPGKSMNEFLVRKRKLRRRSWIKFFLIFLLLSLTREYFGYLGGWYTNFEIKQLSDLQIAQGILYVDPGGGRIPEPRVGLKDESGNVILRLNAGLCGGSDSIQKYSGRKVTVWFNKGPGHNVNWIYQLETGGQAKCDLVTANENAERKNRDKLFFWFRIGWFLATGTIVGLYCYLVYRKGIAELYGEGERI